MSQRSSSTRRQILAHVIANGSVLLAILAWAYFASEMKTDVFPGPLAVGRTLLGLLTDPAFYVHLGTSMFRVCLSIVLALIIGTALAFIPYYFPTAWASIHSVLRPVLNSIPSVAWAILATVWFGVSFSSVLFVQTAILIPFCLINISEGLRDLDSDVVEMGNSFTRKRSRVFRKILIPLMYPYFFASIKMSYGVAWKVSLVAELFGANSGLGYLMLQAQYLGKVETLLALCLCIVGVFLLGERLILRPLERKLNPSLQ